MEGKGGSSPLWDLVSVSGPDSIFTHLSVNLHRRTLAHVTIRYYDFLSLQ